MYLSQLDGSFSHNFFRVGFRYLWKTSNFALPWEWYGAESILLIPNCFNTWSRRWFLNSMPLSDRIYLGHMWTGRYWLMKVDTILYADLSGVAKASGHPVRLSIIVRICLLPELEVLHLWQFYWMVCLESLSSEEGRLGLCLFLCIRGCSLQCISWCPYSYPSSKTGIL